MPVQCLTVNEKTTLEDLLALPKGVYIIEGFNCNFDPRELERTLLWYKANCNNEIVVCSQGDFLSVCSDLTP